MINNELRRKSMILNLKDCYLSMTSGEVVFSLSNDTADAIVNECLREMQAKFSARHLLEKFRGIELPSDIEADIKAFIPDLIETLMNIVVKSKISTNDCTRLLRAELSSVLDKNYEVLFMSVNNNTLEIEIK